MTHSYNGNCGSAAALAVATPAVQGHLRLAVPFHSRPSSTEHCMQMRAAPLSSPPCCAGVAQAPSLAGSNPAGLLPQCNYTLLSGLLKETDVEWVAEVHTGWDAAQKQWVSEQLPARLQLKHCQLRRFSVEEAHTCLSGRPLIFIGDSVTRYQVGRRAGMWGVGGPGERAGGRVAWRVGG